MVVRIQASHPRMEGTLSYNQRKVERGVARVVCSSGLPSASPEEVRRIFARYENRNRSSDRVSFQLSLNPDPASPGERLSDGEVREFAGVLMDGLGYGKQPYVVYEHHDIDRIHYHVVSIRTDWNGKKIRDYKEQMRCQRLMRENAQRFHYRVGDGTAGLTPPKAPPAHRFDPLAGDIRAQYLSLFREAAHYRFSTLAQLKAVCSSMGLSLDTRDAPGGPEIILQGMDREGRVVSPRISGRELGEDLFALFEERTRQCAALPTVPRDVKRRVGWLVSTALSRTRSEEAFLAALSRRGIHATLFRTSGGDIYGATFVDDASKTALKGSELPGITTKAYREADARWKADAVRKEAEAMTRDRQADLPAEAVRGDLPDGRDDAPEMIETLVEEEVVDILDTALDTASRVLGRAGDFGAASKDDRTYRKKKKKVIRRMR